MGKALKIQDIDPVTVESMGALVGRVRTVEMKREDKELEAERARGQVVDLEEERSR